MADVIPRSKLQEHQGEKFVGPVELQDGAGMYLKPPVLTTAERDALGDLAEGMIIHNSDLHVEQEWNGTKWCTLTDTKSVTFVVASVHSVETRASFVCDGEDDQVEIQAALDALPSQGGTVILLEGDYDITANINVPGKATLQGQGYGTHLDAHGSAITQVIQILQDDGAVRNLRIEAEPGIGSPGLRPNLIYCSSRSRILIEGCYLKGDNSVSDGKHGIRLSACKMGKVINCYIEGNKTAGIYIRTGFQTTVANCICQNTGYYGIRGESSAKMLVTGNTCIENSSTGIFLQMCSRPTITSNICNENGRSGIWFERNISNGVINGNTCLQNEFAGIELGRNSHSNAINGNSCCENGFAGIYVGWGAHHTAVTGNLCRENEADGIKLYGYGGGNNDYNTLMGNACTANEGYGINIIGGAYTNKNIVMGNQLTGNTSGALNDSGTNTVSETAAADKYNVEV